MRRIAGAVRVRASTRESAVLHDQILVADRTALEVTLEDFPRARSIARLRRQAGAGDMRRHAMMGHRAPRMILRRRLREPHISGITRELVQPALRA